MTKSLTQPLMKNDTHFLLVQGFQNTLLADALAFDIVRGDCVQILHSGGNH